MRSEQLFTQKPKVEIPMSENFVLEINKLPDHMRDFATASVQNLLNINSYLIKKNSRLQPGDMTQNIIAWINDQQHGVRHSYDVFQKAKEVRDKEEMKDVTDDQLYVRSVLHDAGEFLSRSKKSSEQHNYIMAGIANYVGGELKVDDAAQLATDIYFHDYFWMRPTEDHMRELNSKLSPAGKILADADRLVFSDVKEAIKRNRIGSIGRWYMFRDLSVDERFQWRTRTKGLYDGFCALLAEFNGPDYLFYTKIGKEMNRERNKQFEDEMVAFYRNEYNEGRKMLARAQPLIGIRNKSNTFSEVAAEDAEQLPNFTSNVTGEKLTKLTNLPISSLQENLPDGQKGRQYFGYSIFINGEWFDPSVLRFTDEDHLERFIRNQILLYRETQRK